jgi:RHS repeat-associated protein
VLIRDGWTQIWDGENRLIETSKGDMKLTFAYDYLGRRIEKRVYQEKILQDHLQFVYDDFKQVEELNDVPEIYKSYCWQPEDVGLDFPLIMNTIEGSFYYHTDANKNIVELTDNSANISAHYEYNIFGQSTMVYGSHSENNLFRFSSEYYDRETELLYYNFRYYFPSFGRWISYDPIGENGGKNLYIFLDNNPVDFIDHKGLWSVNFAIDKRFSVGLRGYVSISSKVNLGGGNGSFSVGVTGGVRFYLSEVILNPPMGTILGVFLEKKDVHQEGRVGIGGNVSIVCQCPRGTSSVNCSVDKAIARLQLQARLGYQSKQFRVIGVAEAGGKWDMLTGDLSLYGSLNVKAQRKTLGVWVGFEAGTSGEIPLPFSMPFRIAQFNFSIGLPKKCECMDRNIDGSESLLGIF